VWRKCGDSRRAPPSHRVCWLTIRGRGEIGTKNRRKRTQNSTPSVPPRSESLGRVNECNVDIVLLDNDPSEERGEEIAELFRTERRPPESVIGSYSIQLENALVRPDKKAVAMRAHLEDIVRRDNRMFLEFSDWEDLYLTLEASPEIVEQVLKEHPSKFFAEYAIIAEVQSVQKPTFQVAAETTGDGPEVEIQAADKLHVRGRCVVLLNLEGAKK
jgi:hypothetical protein